MQPSIFDVLAERQKTHGEFTSHAIISQNLKQIIHECLQWHSLSPEKQEALDMIQHKIARILNGDPNALDHWTDICGYAQLVANTLKPVQATITPSQSFVHCAAKLVPDQFHPYGCGCAVCQAATQRKHPNTCACDTCSVIHAKYKTKEVI